MPLTFLKQMLSIPPKKPLTATQRFTFVSAFVAYILGGLSIALVPDTWNIVFGLDLSLGGRNYAVLTGEGLFIVGFCYVILARGKSYRVPGHGAILATVIERLVLINCILFSLFSNSLVTLQFLLTFSILDSGLAIITFAIWYQDVEEASLERFFSEIWAVVNPLYTSNREPLHIILQWMGYLQFIIGFIAPNVLKNNGVVPKQILGTHAEGLLLCFFITFSVHGLLHAMAGGDCNQSIPAATIFYRMVWNIPFFLFAGLTSKIEMVFATGLITFDIVYCLIVFLLLFIFGETRAKEN